MKLSMKYIILFVKDQAKSIKFYRDILGLPLRARHGSYVEFDTGATILALNTLDSVRNLTGFCLPDAPASCQSYELSFVVEDVPSVIEELRVKGVPVLKEPAPSPWGEVVACVKDPDGHNIEFCSTMNNT